MLGICNGFQILLEAGLLPGAMLRNRGLKFRCEHVHVRVEQTDTPFTWACRRRTGAAGCRSRTARATTSLPRRSCAGSKRGPAGRVPLRGPVRGRDRRRPTRTARSRRSPGICNEGRNVVGMMPHPERACESVLGSADGLGCSNRWWRPSAPAPLACAGRERVADPCRPRHARAGIPMSAFDQEVLDRHGLSRDEYDAHRRARSAASPR